MPAEPVEGRRHLTEELGRRRIVAKSEPEDPPIHIGDIEVVGRRWISVEGEAEEPHVGVGHGRDGGRIDEMPCLVVRKHALAIRIELPAGRRRGEEVSPARGDVDAGMVDSNAERVPRVRDGREDGRVAYRWSGRFACERGRDRRHERHRPHNSNGSQFHE